MHRSWMCAPMMILLLVTACGSSHGHRAEQLALELRSEALEQTYCEGEAELTADYGSRVYTYDVEFSWKQESELVLTVTAPEHAAGITARVRKDGSSLEYDGIRLETGALDDGGLSPMGALPVLFRSIREDFMAECSLEMAGDTELLRVCCRDPKLSAGSGREVTLWLRTEDHALIRGEIASDGVTVIQCIFTQFHAGSEEISR